MNNNAEYQFTVNKIICNLKRKFEFINVLSSKNVRWILKEEWCFCHKKVSWRPFKNKNKDLIIKNTVYKIYEGSS